MTKGIHHITAISSDPQVTYDFYAKVLGLRMVKRSVNQDDTSTYHLFFGDKLGHPGMDLTFFTFQPTRQGKNGNGLVIKISLAIREESLEFWKTRFEKLNIKHEEISIRFRKQRIVFYDQDNQCLELVGLSEAELDTEFAEDIWSTAEIDKSNAIRCFHSATLSVSNKAMIEPILMFVLGYTKSEKENHINLYKAKDSTRGQYLEVNEDLSHNYGVGGAGTVHHIAFRAEDEAQELFLRDKLSKIGLYPTEVIDRYYFKSVYFKTPAGILFEIATDTPGFTADEFAESLGDKLALPPFLEGMRADIESNLTPINTN